MRMAELFGQFQMISGLTLHPGKCVLVLTSAHALPQVVAAIRYWLHYNIPQWESMNISNVGTYLGMALGPASKGVIWKDAVNKFRRRALDINRAKMPAVLSIRAYNTKAVSVLGYIAQFSSPSRRLSQAGDGRGQSYFEICHQ